MKSLLRKLLFENWQRKSTSILLAVIIWLVVNQTLTTSKTLTNIPVKIVNIPEGKTIQGLQGNGQLKRKMTITLVGNKTLIDDLSSSDMEVIVDANEKQDEWNPIVTPKNLVSLNPEIDLAKAVSKIYHQPFTVRQVKLVTERIPILITKPIGDAPRDYQFLDVWPYSLTMTVTGAEDVIKRIKSKEIRLNFNLNDISKAQLDAIQADAKETDVVSFVVPESWKQITLPLISDSPIEINDPLAKNLRIDFLRCDLFPLEKPLLTTLFYPQKYLHYLNPKTYSLSSGDLIKEVNGVYLTSQPLFVKGVSHLFLQIVRDMLEIEVIASPKPEKGFLDWSMQFVNPRHLENLYVQALLSDGPVEDGKLQPSLREEYLRNRFRNYMNRFMLYKADGTKFQLKAEVKDNIVQVKS